MQQLPQKQNLLQIEADCDDCQVTLDSGQTRIDHPDGSSTLRCVKCPFCKQIVDAHMTKTSISCPKCNAHVNY